MDEIADPKEVPLYSLVLKFRAHSGASLMSSNNGRNHRSAKPLYMQGCRKIVKSGGGNILDYVLLHLYRGVWGHAPQKIFGIFVL